MNTETISRVVKENINLDKKTLQRIQEGLGVITFERIINLLTPASRKLITQTIPLQQAPAQRFSTKEDLQLKMHDFVDHVLEELEKNPTNGVKMFLKHKDTVLEEAGKRDKVTTFLIRGINFEELAKDVVEIEPLHLLLEQVNATRTQEQLSQLVAQFAAMIKDPKLQQRLQMNVHDVEREVEFLQKLRVAATKMVAVWEDRTVPNALERSAKLYDYFKTQLPAALEKFGDTKHATEVRNYFEFHEKKEENLIKEPKPLLTLVDAMLTELGQETPLARLIRNREQLAQEINKIVKEKEQELYDQSLNLITILERLQASLNDLNNDVAGAMDVVETLDQAFIPLLENIVASMNANLAILQALQQGTEQQSVPLAVKNLKDLVKERKKLIRIVSKLGKEVVVRAKNIAA